MNRKECLEKIKIDKQFKSFYWSNYWKAKNFFKNEIIFMKQNRPNMKIVLHHIDYKTDKYEEWNPVIPMYHDDHCKLHNSGRKYNHTEETKLKISSIFKGKSRKKESVLKGAETVKNKDHKKIKCLETGKIYHSIAAAQRETGFCNISSCAAGNRRNAGGFHWTFDLNQTEIIEIPYANKEQTRKKMSLAKKGKKPYEMTDNIRKKISITLQNKPKIQVKCIDTGEINSIKYFSEKYNIKCSSKIGEVCNGKRKTAGKFHWEWVS